MRIPKSKALYVSAAVIVLLSGFAVTARAAYKTVTVQDNGQRSVISGFTFGTVATFLKQGKVIVSRRDRVVPALTSPVADGMHVVIQRPVQIAVIDEGTGKQVRLWTFVSTVGQVLQQTGIKLRTLDRVNHPRSATLVNGERILIRRVARHVVTAEREIPFQTLRQRTDSLYSGEQRVLTYGVQGLLRVKTTEVIVNGHKARNSVERKIVRHAVNEVIEIGTKARPYVLASRDAGPVTVIRQWTVVATAYQAGGHTATGWPAQPGVVAVDPHVIPLGTKLYISGIGVVYAEDTGGSIIGNRIDICLATYGDARSWGVRTIVIYQIH